MARSPDFLFLHLITALLFLPEAARFHSRIVASCEHVRNSSLIFGCQLPELICKVEKVTNIFYYYHFWSSNIFPDLRGVALVAGLVEHVLVALETLEYHASVTVQNLDKINVIRQIKTISHYFCLDVDTGNQRDRLNSFYLIFGFDAYACAKNMYVHN